MLPTSLQPGMPPTAQAVAVPPRVRLDAAGRIDDDIPCRKCGYNLRSLAATARCTECGTAVGRSLMGDLLRFCDPDWVQKLASGMNWIIFGSIAGALIGFVIGIAATMSGSTAAFEWLIMAAQVVAGIFPLIGYWKLTQPDPSGIGERPGVTSRKLTRALCIVNYVGTPLQGALVMVSVVVGGVVMVVSGLAGVALMFAVFVYARSLALRLPDEKLARNIRTVMWGYGIVTALAVLLAFVVSFWAGTGAGGAAMVTGPTLGPGGTYLSGTPYVEYDEDEDAEDGAENGAEDGDEVGAERAVEEEDDRVVFAETAENEDEGLDDDSTAAAGGGAGGGAGGVAGGAGGGAPMGAGAIAGIVGLGVVGCFFGVASLVFGIWTIVLVFRFRKKLKEAAWQARHSWMAEARPVSAA